MKNNRELALLIALMVIVTVAALLILGGYTYSLGRLP